MKRRIAIILCFVLLLSAVSLPQAVLAGPTDPATTVTIAGNFDVDAKTGTGYDFDGNGVLTLTDFVSDEPIRWTEGTLTIIVLGTCSVAGIDGSAADCGVLTISGDAANSSLAIASTDVNGISAHGLMVDGVKMTVTSTDAAAILLLNGKLTLELSSITVTSSGDYPAVHVQGGDIIQRSGSITATSSGKYSAIWADRENDKGGEIMVQRGVMKATNTCTMNASPWEHAIYAEYGMEVTDGGEVVAQNSNGMAAAVRVMNESLVVDGGTMTATNSGPGGASLTDAIYARNIFFNDAQIKATGADYGIYAIEVLDITDSVVDAESTLYTAMRAMEMKVSGSSDIRATGIMVGIRTNSLTVRDNPRIVAEATGYGDSDAYGTGIWIDFVDAALDVDLSSGGSITATGVRGEYNGKNRGGSIQSEYPSSVMLGAKTKVADEQMLIDGGVDDYFAQAYGKDGVVAEETILYAAVTMKATAGAGGSITPAGEKEVIPRRDYTYTMTPNEGYQVKDVLVDGQSVGAWLEYTFTDVNADHTIEVVFEEVVIPSITISGPATVKVGETFTLTVNQQGGDWEYDKAYLSYKDGVFTALKVGKTTITYKGDGVVGTHVLTITDTTPAPKTGDSTGGMPVLLVSLLGALAGATVLQRRKRTS